MRENNIKVGDRVLVKCTIVWWFFDVVEPPDYDDDEGCIDIHSGKKRRALNSQRKGLYNKYVMCAYMYCCSAIVVV